MRALLLIVLVNLSILYAAAQGQYRFINRNADHGLSHNQVNCIIKDQKGFMWFGTVSGLNRFDGYSFRVFRNQPDDSTSLHNNEIYNLFVAPDRKLLISGRANVSNWGQEAWIDEAFGMMKAKFVDHDIPVILGEYAAMLRSSLSVSAYADHIKSRNHYLNYINSKAIENGLIPFYWDNGVTGDTGSGLFNRATGEQVYPDAIEALVSPFQ